MKNSVFAAFVSDINIKPRDRTQVVFGEFLLVLKWQKEENI